MSTVRNRDRVRHLPIEIGESDSIQLLTSAGFSLNECLFGKVYGRTSSII